MKLRTTLIILLAGAIIGALLMYIISGKSSKDGQITISHNMVVEKIESMGNLEVLKYNIQDIVKYEKARQWLPNAKTAIVVVGEVIYCVDLTKIKAEDVIVAGDSIQLILPAPEVCHVKVDHSQSHIYNIEYGFWESDEIIDDAYRYAEKELERQATQLDMTSKSRDNTVTLLRPLLQAMGFNQVMITFRTGTIE